jgi:hypothetical protein
MTDDSYEYFRRMKSGKEGFVEIVNCGAVACSFHQPRR